VSSDVLAGGRWLRTRGGVKVWEVVQSDAPVMGQPVTEQREHLDMHELFACTTCPARVDEPCRTPTGGRVAHGGHAGRLAPRLCRCGSTVIGNARMCPPCANESHRVSQQLSVQKRRQIARAVERERRAA
jgi:hypothetical protein